ncbi:MAG: saccharopine dehydrogenase NADP-binding domain-containing protein [Rhizomicrobium sp.]
MKNVLLVGGGKIGVAITELLSATGDYRVTVADRDAASLGRMPAHNVATRQVEIGDAVAFAQTVKGHDIVLSAHAFNLTATVAEAAKRAGAHYLDLTEDVESTRTIKALAQAPTPPSSRNAASPPASSPSLPTTSPRSSTSCATCRCGSAPCRCFRTTRSNTISPGRPTG